MHDEIKGGKIKGYIADKDGNVSALIVENKGKAYAVRLRRPMEPLPMLR